MTAPPRFQIVTEFAAFEGWRNCLAVDWQESPPRPVVLSFVPARVAEAPERLARLAEDVERAAQLHHPNVLRVLGMGVFGEAPVVLQEWREGESLRELLDTGSRMPPEVAARIVADAASALAHAHGRAAEEGRPFAHGALRAERILVGEDGSVVVSGFGRAAEGDGAQPSHADDVRALGALLASCLAGEQPSASGLPAVPDALARVAARAAEPGSAPASADELRKSISDAVPLAERERVRSWADSVFPPDAGTRGRRTRSLRAALASPAEAAAPIRSAPPAPPRSPEPISEEAIVAALTPPPNGKGALAAATPGASAVPARPQETGGALGLSRPAPLPGVAWNAVAGAAAAALAAGILLGVLLGR